MPQQYWVKPQKSNGILMKVKIFPFKQPPVTSAISPAEKKVKKSEQICCLSRRIWKMGHRPSENGSCPQVFRPASFLRLGRGSTLHNWTTKHGANIIKIVTLSLWINNICIVCIHFTHQELSSVALRWQTRRQVVEKWCFCRWLGKPFFFKKKSGFK